MPPAKIATWRRTFNWTVVSTSAISVATRAPTGVGVRAGCLFRSDELHALTAGDLEVVSRLGIRVVFDLRNAQERAARPNRLPAEIELLERTSPSASPMAVARTIEELMALGDLPVPDDDDFAMVYVDLLDRLAPELRTIVERAVEAPARPLLFHCASGKDRTGITAAVLLGLLGVPDEVILDEYELTSIYSAPRRLDALAAAMAEHGVSDERIRPLLEARRPVLSAAIRHIHAHYEGFDRYATEHLGVDEISRSRASRGAACIARFELEVQAADAAQDVGRHVLVAAGAGGAVLRLGDPDVVHAVEEPLDGDAALGARERRAGARVDAVAERDVLARVGAVDVGTRRDRSKRRGSRLAAPLSTITVVPAGMSTPPTVGRARARAGSRPSPGSRCAGTPRRSSGCARGRSRSSCWSSGSLADALQRGAEEAHGRLLAGGEQVGGDAHDVDDLGHRAVGERRGRQPVITSSRGSRRRSSM